MPYQQLDPQAALPAWNRLNNVDLFDVTPREIPGRGVGFVVDRDINCAADGVASPAPSLARIPKDLVLSREAVEDHAKVDRHFRELLDAVGRKSNRADICLFLTAQRVLASAPTSGGVATPFTEYVKLLPAEVPVPTMWTEEERELLLGTSLETAVKAKISALTHEYDDFREKSSELPFWNQLLWDDEGQDATTVRLSDWFLADAWYRSRSLELPRSGEAMVPVLDLANHSSEANAYYDEVSRSKGGGKGGYEAVELLLRPSRSSPGEGRSASAGVVRAGEEITISYGEGKSGAEMLFSYGFIDPARATDSVALPLAPMEEDPLGRAKLHAFDGPAVVELAVADSSDSRTSGSSSKAVEWTSPFAWLTCLNEEDGLDFRVLQDHGGNRELRVFWQEDDVTGRMQDLEELARDHPLFEIFRLRAIMVVLDRVASQLERLTSGARSADGSADEDGNAADEHDVGDAGQELGKGVERLELKEQQQQRQQKAGESSTETTAAETQPSGGRGQTGPPVRAGIVNAVKVLREQEASVLQAAVQTLEEQRDELLANEDVVAYLGSKEISQKEQADDASSNGSEDFS